MYKLQKFLSLLGIKEKDYIIPKPTLDFTSYKNKMQKKVSANKETLKVLKRKKNFRMK